MDINKYKDLTASIRLATRKGLPLPQDIRNLSDESRRSKKRVELPWQPDWRSEPVVLSASYDEASGKTHWALYDGSDKTAPAVWSAAGAEPAKVVQALRDWFAVARLAESWTAAHFEQPTEAGSLPASAGAAQLRPPEGLPAPEAQRQAPQPAGKTYSPGILTPSMPFPAFTEGEPAAVSYPGSPDHASSVLPPIWQPGYPPQFAPVDAETAAQQWALAGVKWQAAAGQAPGKELVHPLTFEAAIACQRLLAAGRLSVGQAIISIGFCERSRVGLRDAFSEMGWDVEPDAGVDEDKRA